MNLAGPRPAIGRPPANRQHADAGDPDGATWQDDIDVRRKSASGALKVFSLVGALFFILVGAGLYAITGWPSQGTAPAVAGPSPREPAPVAQTPPPTSPAPVASPAPPPPAPLPAIAALPAPDLRLPPPEPPPPPPVEQAPAPVAAAPPPAAAPSAPPPPSAERLAEARQLTQRALRILEQTKDIAAARLFLDRAANLGDPDAFFRLAETYDPAWLARIGARGVAGDPARARTLYQQALDRGVTAARERLATLR